MAFCEHKKPVESVPSMDLRLLSDGVADPRCLRCGAAAAVLLGSWGCLLVPQSCWLCPPIETETSKPSGVAPVAHFLQRGLDVLPALVLCFPPSGIRGMMAYPLLSPGTNISK